LDRLRSNCWIGAVEFPDQKIVMRRDKAEELMKALKRAIDYVDAGIEHPNSRFFDDD
jgi:hypothetical protein